MTKSAKTTTDHDKIKQWVEQRNGHPAVVKGTRDLLRIDFGQEEPELEQITWNEFFEAFEQNKLAFLYEDELENGVMSRFNKIVSRQ